MNISKDKLTNLKKWYLENGIHPRKKKSGEYLYSSEILELYFVISFIMYVHAYHQSLQKCIYYVYFMYLVNCQPVNTF